MRVHGIARRTAVRFLGQQSEVTVDDTWPQAGEARNLWKGITEFWTDDMLQDATWRPNRHHSNFIPLFRNHVTQDTAAMFPPPPSPVISVEHGYRDSRLSAVPHTENAEEKRRRVVLGMSELSHVCSSHHYVPPVPQNLKTLLLKQTGFQQRDADTSWSSPGKWHGKGKYASAVRGHHQRPTDFCTCICSITGMSNFLLRN